MVVRQATTPSLSPLPDIENNNILTIVDSGHNRVATFSVAALSVLRAFEK